MPMKPLPMWMKSYDPKQQESFLTNIPFWGFWVDENAQGLQVGPPYQSQAITNPAAFNPLAGLLAAQSPVETANILATAWQTWYMAIQFPPSPPVPPFSVITAITPSPAGVAAAYSALLSGLIAELTAQLPDPVSAPLIKGTNFGTLFHTATMSAGVQIVGLGIGAPPPPLTLPLIPVL